MQILVLLVVPQWILHQLPFLWIIMPPKNSTNLWYARNDALIHRFETSMEISCYWYDSQLYLLRNNNTWNILSDGVHCLQFSYLIDRVSLPAIQNKEFLILQERTNSIFSPCWILEFPLILEPHQEEGHLKLRFTYSYSTGV
jgi:hypothetical protein